jgi:predicted O-methyltransferase YrrM
LGLSRSCTVIIADNVVRDGEVADPEASDPRVQAVRRYLEQLAAEPRVQSTVIQTVGSKGYDGFAISVVR